MGLDYGNIENKKDGCEGLRGSSLMWFREYELTESTDTCGFALQPNCGHESFAHKRSQERMGPLHKVRRAVAYDLHKLASESF